MADARGGSGGIEEELVGAAMQISTMRQELKSAKLDLDSAAQENQGWSRKSHENESALVVADSLQGTK